MPTFEIGLQDGRKLHIEADSQEAALAGVQHFMAQDAQKDRTLVGALTQGAQNVKHGFGQTADVLQGNTPQPAAPSNYEPASPTRGFEQGIGSGLAETARSGAEMLPGSVLPLAAAAAAKRFLGRRLAIPAAGLTAAAEMFGPNVAERMKNMGHEAPTNEDLGASAGTTAAQAALAALPAGRLLPGANPITSTGVKGMLDSAAKLAATTGAEAASAAGQSAVGQAGATAGTPGGMQVDPRQVADTALGGGAMGLGLAGPRAAADISTARKFSDIAPAQTDAAAALSQRIQDAATGGLKNTRTAKEALDAAEGDVHRELKDATKALKGKVDADTANVLARASAGEKLNTADLKTAENLGDPALLHLIQQAQVARSVRNSGFTVGGRLVGGLAGGLEAGVHAFQKPLQTAAGTVGSMVGYGALPGFVGMYAPHTVLPLAAGYSAARAFDAMSGARSPVDRFVRRFQQSGAQPRLPAQAAPPEAAAPGAAPWGPRGPGPTGPQMPMVPEAPADPSVGLKEQIKEAMDLMAARQANARMQKQAAQSDRSALRDQMMDASAQMAARRANAPPQEKVLDPVKQQIAEATMLMSARKANAAQQAREASDLMAARVANGAPTPLQRAQMADARELTAARRANDTSPEGPVSAPAESAPTVKKVSKANGKVEHAVSPMEEAVASSKPPFQPLSPEEMPYAGWTHEAVAADKIANRPDYNTLSLGRRKIIEAGIVKRRAADEASVLKRIDEVPFDQRGPLEDLLNELHHTSSRRRAREARDHYTSLLPPDVAVKVRADLSDAVINKSKPKD